MTTTPPRRSQPRGVSRLRNPRPAFTLVEILVVIAIIGILAAALIPAATSAIRTARETAIRTEINVIDNGVESYKLKFGEYPPDFSDWRAVETHFRKIFPGIDESELKLLAQFTHLDSNFERVPLAGSGATANLDPRSSAAYAHYRQCIDPAEALVFCLGGYSSDKKRPFTGQGGPLSPITVPGGSVTADYGKVQYNASRDNAFVTFDSTQLSIFIAADPSNPTSANPCAAGSAYTYSNDEYQSAVNGTSAQGAYSTRQAPTLSAGFNTIRFLVDPFPVYVLGGESSPLVYFDAKSYKRTFTPPTVTGGWASSAPAFHSLNIYLHPGNEASLGVARPYLSNQADTNAGGFLWIENKRFQLISPGQDGSFGGNVEPGVAAVPSAPAAAGLVSIYPTGQFANARGELAGSGSQNKYEDSESVYSSDKPQFDNVTNFSTRTLESDLP